MTQCQWRAHYPHSGPQKPRKIPLYKKSKLGRHERPHDRLPQQAVWRRQTHWLTKLIVGEIQNSSRNWHWEIHSPPLSATGTPGCLGTWRKWSGNGRRPSWESADTQTGQTPINTNTYRPKGRKSSGKSTGPMSTTYWHQMKATTNHKCQKVK